MTPQRHHQLVTVGVQVSRTGQLHSGDHERVDFLSLEIVQPGTERLVTGFALAPFGVVRQSLELVPIGLVVIALALACLVPLRQTLELVGLVEVRVGFLGLGEALGALLETFEDNPVERDGREDAAIECIGAIAADSQQNASFGQDESPFWSYQGTTTQDRHLDRPVPFHLVSVFNPLVVQGVEGFPEVAFGSVTTSVVVVLYAARPFVREPRIDLALPAVGKFVLALQPPGGVGEVVEGRIIFPLGVVALVENGVFGQPLREAMVGVEGVRDLAVTVDPDAEPVHVADRPVRVTLEDHVGVVARREGLQGTGNDICVTLVEQARVPVMRIGDGPVLRVIDLTLPIPYEARPRPPVASRFTSGILKSHFADHAHWVPPLRWGCCLACLLAVSSFESGS